MSKQTGNLLLFLAGNTVLAIIIAVIACEWLGQYRDPAVLQLILLLYLFVLWLLIMPILGGCAYRLKSGRLIGSILAGTLVIGTFLFTKLVFFGMELQMPIILSGAALVVADTGLLEVLRKIALNKAVETNSGVPDADESGKLEK